jgi:hypothetical protein
MTQSLNILFKAAPHEVEHHLPITLGRIKEIADSCTNEAQSVVDQYNRVIDTLHELQISSLAAQGRTKEAREMADSEAKQKREEMNALDEVGNFILIICFRDLDMLNLVMMVWF